MKKCILQGLKMKIYIVLIETTMRTKNEYIKGKKASKV
jgi:hypothetical protein